MPTTNFKIKEIQLRGRVYRAKEKKWVDMGILSRKRYGLIGIWDNIYYYLKNKFRR